MNSVNYSDIISHSPYSPASTAGDWLGDLGGNPAVCSGSGCKASPYEPPKISNPINNTNYVKNIAKNKSFLSAMKGAGRFVPYLGYGIMAYEILNAAYDYNLLGVQDLIDGLRNSSETDSPLSQLPTVLSLNNLYQIMTAYEIANSHNHYFNNISSSLSGIDSSLKSMLVYLGDTYAINKRKLELSEMPLSVNVSGLDIPKFPEFPKLSFLENSLLEIKNKIAESGYHHENLNNLMVSFLKVLKEMELSLLDIKTFNREKTKISDNMYKSQVYANDSIIKANESIIKTNDLTSENYNYQKQEQSISDLDGNNNIVKSPREIEAMKNASALRKTTDENNFRLDDEDFDLLDIDVNWLQNLNVKVSQKELMGG